MGIKANVAEFLRNQDVRSMIFLHGDNRQTYLHKAQFNDTTDFIYGCGGYRGSPLSFKGKMEWQGFIHHPTLTISELGYEIRSMIGYDTGLEDFGIITVSVSDINKKYLEQLGTEVLKIATRYGLFDAAKQGNLQPQSYINSWGRLVQDEDCESMIRRSAELASKAYAEHKTEIPYTPYFPNATLTESEIVEFLDDGGLFTKTKANKFFTESTPSISNAVLLNHLTNKHLDELNSAEGGHSKFRAMADSITDQKTVTLDVVRDSVPLTVKYDAEHLKRCLKNTDNSIWNWNMDAPSRREFENTYGKRADLLASDIVAIRYGKKTLWEKGE